MPAATVKSRFTPRQQRLKAARRFPVDGVATIAQAATFLCCHRASVYRMVRSGLLHSVSIGESEKRIPWPVLWKFISHDRTA